MVEIIGRSHRIASARVRSEETLTPTLWLELGGILLLALVPKLFMVWQSGFDGLYGQDAYAYFGYARQMQAALSQNRMPPQFWWPLGYPALLDLGFIVFGTSIRAAQAITMLCGILIAPASFLLAREAVLGKGSNLAGVITGAIVAMSGQLVQSSIAIMSDAPALLWATLGAWLLLLYRRSYRLTVLLLSAICMALAVITRWENLGLLIVWLGVFVIVSLFPAKLGERNRNAIDMTRFVFHLACALALVAFVFLPQIIIQVQYATPLAGQSWLEGWKPQNAFRSSFDTVDGRLNFALPVAVFYAQVLFHPAYLFPLFTLFLPAGLRSLLNALRTDAGPLSLFTGWIAVFYFFLAGIPYENFRFGLGFLPPVAALAAIGVAWIWDRLAIHRSTKLSGSLRFVGNRGVRFAFAGSIFLALVGTVIWEPRVAQPMLAEKQIELADAEWLSSRTPASSVLFTFGMTEALKAYTSLTVKDLSEESPDRVVANMRTVPSPFLFINVSNVESQWKGKSLETNLRLIRDEVGLREIDKIGDYTLFLVGPTQ